ncbi:hypothetical protein DdX_15848 [Ditylenchus destructor]|uniref:Uncharacterized protein n=1 Tax=Ditylenchus destructor TaxID=166010 RepID=A0AAD4MQM0_9BILA|nr:hypothetical protein DdX_15848 [Ditylenchus destructor]
MEGNVTPVEPSTQGIGRDADQTFLSFSGTLSLSRGRAHYFLFSDYSRYALVNNTRSEVKRLWVRRSFCTLRPAISFDPMRSLSVTLLAASQFCAPAAGPVGF